MKKYKLSLQAEQDLLNMFLVGIEKWGDRQAEKYATELHDCFNLLAEHPEMGIARKDLQNNPHSLVKGSHVIFYRQAGATVEISTVLHQSMDVQSRFK